MDSKAMFPLKLVCLLCLLAFAVSGCKNSVLHFQSQGSGYAQDDYYGQDDGYVDFPAGRPLDFQEFKDRYQMVGASPEGAVRMYFDAVYSYIEPARRAEGAKMLRYSLHEGRNWERSASLATFVSRLKSPMYHYIFRSFAEGTAPETDYAMDPDNYSLMFEEVREEADYVRVMIWSSGVDNPRPLHVQQFEDGLWYVVNNHGTYSDVRKPARQIRRGGHDADRD